MVIRFPLGSGCLSPGLLASIEAGPDLATWPMLYQAGSSSETSSPGVEVIENSAAPDTIRVTIPRAGAAKLFARLKVSQTDP